MANPTAAVDQRTDHGRDRPPYSPSPLDVFTAWIDKLPGPAWLYYVGLYAALLALDLLMRAGDSIPSLPPTFVLIFLTPLPYGLFFIHYADRYAMSALSRFRPGLTCDDGVYDELCYRLTTMPAAPMMLNTIVGAIVGVLFLLVIPESRQLSFIDIAVDDPGREIGRVLAVIAFASSGFLIYHTWHQLRVVSQIYRTYTSVDLFHQQPLYAFSDLSARTAVGWLLISFGWSIAAPQLFEVPLAVVYIIVMYVISALTFIFPLLGIHNLLKQHKETLLATNGEQFRKATAVLHQRIESGQTTDMDNLNKTLQSLELEHQIIKRTPTWPWSPEAPRTVVAAILLPLVLWVMQSVLQRIMLP